MSAKSGLTIVGVLVSLPLIYGVLSEKIAALQNPDTLFLAVPIWFALILVVGAIFFGPMDI